MEKLEKQPCPICKKNTLTLMEDEKEVPYFGKLYVFSMSCENCKYHKADVESAEEKEPVKFSIDIKGEKDMNIRIVKSAQATVKIPYITTIEPGPGSNGYITNIEGILKRVKRQLESAKESEEDKSKKKKLKNMLKKLKDVMWGKKKIKIIIEDPSGNSAIISDKAKKSKLKT